MSDFIKGKNLRLKFDGKWLLHATECAISIQRDQEEIATKDTVGKEYVDGDYSYTLSTSALVARLPSGNTTHETSDYLIDALLNGDEIPFEFTTGVVGDIKRSGVVKVTQADVTATNGSVAGTSFSFQGSGTLERTVITA